MSIQDYLKAMTLDATGSTLNFKEWTKSTKKKKK